MSKIEQVKSYAGRDLETIFFRPMMTGPDALNLGVNIMYNVPVPTTLHFWRRQGDILQKYGAAGWNGSAKSQKFQKTIQLSKVKAEMGYSAQDYFDRVYQLIAARADVNLQDLSGTELEEAETSLFKQAIAESIRMTMWYGDTQRTDDYATFDGFLKRITADIAAGESQMCAKIYDTLADPAEAEKLFKAVFAAASNELKMSKGQGNLVYLVTSDVYNAYEEALNGLQLESSVLARQHGREGLFYNGIPVIDLQLGVFKPADLPSSFVLLTDRRNLALAVNTSDFPGSEVRMWYNPDLMENRQRATFMAGCDYLLPEMVSMAVKGAGYAVDKAAVTASGGPVTFQVSSNTGMVESVLVVPLSAGDGLLSAEQTMTRNGNNFSATLTGSSIVKIRFTVKYTNGSSTQIVIQRA